MSDKSELDGLAIGRIVHFVLPTGEHRPAIIVRTWPDDWSRQHGTANLLVWLDGLNDLGSVANQGDWVLGGQLLATAPMLWVSSTHYDATAQESRTWHWPERVGEHQGEKSDATSEAHSEDH